MSTESPDEDLFQFADEEAPTVAVTGALPWKLLVVDDDEEVHTISHIVLRDLVFEGRGVEILAAHSGAEAKALVAANPDAALLLLDVVMETDNAGLDVVRHVRHVLGNSFIRIVLRTGQPGQAPEKSVVIDYDINDYKEKTELTAQKLVTTVIAALRAYRDISIINASRRGLRQVIGASRNLFELQSLVEFSSGVLTQLTSLLSLGDGLCVLSSGVAARRTNISVDDFFILAGTGRFSHTVGRRLNEVMADEAKERVWEAVRARQTIIGEHEFVGYFLTSNGSENVVYLQLTRALSSLDTDLLQVFSANVAVAFDNLCLHEELVEAQAQIAHTLSEVIERRSNETGRHVFRVGECAYLLAQLIGLGKRECDLLHLAAPMHDLGKIAIPDALLHKPGRFTDEEMDRMREHAAVGYHLLQRSSQPALQAAAVVALEHHEWWNGTGYPQGLAGDDIHIYGAITALADVFDALSHPRCYKPAWDMTSVIDYIRQGRGTQFKPELVDAFLARVDDFVAIQINNKDDDPPQELPHQ